MEKPAVATFWIVLEKSVFLSLVSRLPEGSENGSPILGASPTFGGTPQMGWHKLEMGPSKRKSWLLPREESISFHVYLPWTTDQNSDHRSGWLDGQECHKQGRTSGFGGKEGEMAVPSVGPGRDSKSCYLQITLRVTENCWGHWNRWMLREKHVENQKEVRTKAGTFERRKEPLRRAKKGWATRGG